MSSDSDQNDDADPWVYYCDRPEWNDIKPVPQNDVSIGIVAIAYTKKFTDVFDYFRAVLQASEYSQRAFDLTTDAIKLNPANYTVWQFRRDIMKHLKMDIVQEMFFIENIMMDLPKNYQVWHHRHVLVKWSQNPNHELRLTEYILELDSKNYHAWQHRCWVITEFKLYENELDFVDKLLKADQRNNSAWNQRFHIIKTFYGLDGDTIQQEISYVLEKMQIIKNNESAWNYLRGVICHNSGKLSDYPEVQEICERHFNSGYQEACLVSYLFDLYREKYLLDKTDETYYEKAVECLNILATKCDKIRKKYWTYLKEEMRKEYCT